VVLSQGHVVYANQLWLTMTGNTVLGEQCDAWLHRVHPDDAADVARDWALALQRPDKPFRREFRILDGTDGGGVRWVVGQSLAEVAPTPLCKSRREGREPRDGADSAPQVRSVVGAFTDVTERHQLDQERMEATRALAAAQAQRADEADRHRAEVERFIDVVCHEIRNPLNGIVNNSDLIRDAVVRVRAALQELHAAIAADTTATAGAAEALAERTLTASDADLADAETMLASINLCTLHQRRITDDVLDVSRLHAHKYTLQLQDAWLDTIFASVMRMFYADAAAASVQLEWDPDSCASSHVHVRVDVQRLTQILVNLVGNAIKFTKLAPVRRVFLAVYSSPAPGGVHVTIVVTDSGIGMSKEQQAKLFVAFGQATTKTYNVYGGSGLGLVIVKELLDLMHGAIRVDSELGCGSTFTIDLDLASATGETSRTTSPPSPLTGASAMPEGQCTGGDVMGLAALAAASTTAASAAAPPVELAAPVRILGTSIAGHGSESDGVRP